MDKFQKTNEKDKYKPINNSLKENLKYIKEVFSNSGDITIREMSLNWGNIGLITMEGMSDKDEITKSVLNPIIAAKVPKDKEPFSYIKDSVLATSEQIEVKEYKEAFKYLMSGFALLIFDGETELLAIGVQGFDLRGISEPESEVMQKGSREGFIESARANISLIRRRIKSPTLKFELFNIGNISDTEVCLCYLTDKVAPSILEEIKKKLKSTNLDYILAAEYLVPYLEQKGGATLFSSVGVTERPDTLCGKISEGRVAILIDGTPNALIVPFLFIEYFQTLDDYAMKPYFATLTRWLKYFSFFVSILLPGLYVALGTFNPEAFPDLLIEKVATSIATTPFPLMFETLIIHFIYEIMREAGLRLPRVLGHAVSIVGGLVIGETAVSAGLIAGPTLMVVAITAIASYVIPNLYEPIAILRLIFIIVGGTLGIIGMTLFFIGILINICSKSTYNIPFSAPVSPFSLKSMRDVAVRAGWKSLSNKSEKIQNMPGSNINKKDR